MEISFLTEQLLSNTLDSIFPNYVQVKTFKNPKTNRKNTIYVCNWTSKEGVCNFEANKKQNMTKHINIHPQKSALGKEEELLASYSLSTSVTHNN
jgi:hypothetical protein